MRIKISSALACLLVLLGLGAMLGAASSRYRMLAAHLDKESIYLWGRWLDAVWQVQVPLLCAGMGLVSIGVLLLCARPATPATPR